MMSKTGAASELRKGDRIFGCSDVIPKPKSRKNYAKPKSKLKSISQLKPEIKYRKLQ
jgi:hypothetical protein